jgi:glutathione S-transferase
MKLYTFMGSPNGRKVEAVIDHLGLDVEIEYRDFFGGELRSPDFVAINPNAMVPTLVDGAFTLWESNAIMQYLADKGGSDELFPRDIQKRADIARWQFWEVAHFNNAFGTLAFETVVKPKYNIGETNHALVEIARTEIARFAPVLDRVLEGRRYLVGDRITIADYAVIKLESYRSGVPFDWSPLRNLNAYFDRVAASDHWARTAVKDLSIVGRKPKAA